jgi:hypothetical protein
VFSWQRGTDRMSTFDFCADCRKVIPAIANVGTEEIPRCADCAAKSQMEKAFNHIESARNAFFVLSEYPGFHTVAWQKVFYDILNRLQVLNLPGDAPESVAQIGETWIKCFNTAIEELSGVEENDITAAEWMPMCHPLERAKNCFEAVLVEIYDLKHLATEEV